jgi:hypothetical protein
VESARLLSEHGVAGFVFSVQLVLSDSHAFLSDFFCSLLGNSGCVYHSICPIGFYFPYRFFSPTLEVA